MVSRIYRSVTLITFLLLAQAALLSPDEKTKAPTKESDEVLYKRLILALGIQRYIKTNIAELEESSICPFRVLNVKGYTRVVCDFVSCSEMKCKWRRKNCNQVYIGAKDIMSEEFANMTKLEDVADVEFGCIYSPKKSRQSIQTAGPGPKVK